MAKKKSKIEIAKEIIGHKYTLAEEPLGEGGNAKVYPAVDERAQERVAIKILITGGEEKIARFHDEIKVMRENSGIPGIIPILDYDEVSNWYAMPVATTAMKWSKELLRNCHPKPFRLGDIDREPWIKDMVQCIIECAETLEQLHAKGIHHRDIKPDNIYIYNGRGYLGDFGLVEFPDSDNNFTREDKGLGAIFTIAPEMKRNPKDADASKADVYSLAKSLWMFLTFDEKGFDGQYQWNDRSHGLRFYPHLKGEYLVEIEQLLTSATSNAPADRPDIRELKDMLERWLASVANRVAREANEWDFIVKRIFGEGAPDNSVFRKPGAIVRALNILASSASANHMMFPNGGGLDFHGAEEAPEEGFIYIYSDGFINLIKPRALYFETFPDPRWNYFMIEAEEVAPVSGIRISRHGDQELVEDTPAHYVSAEDAVYGVYDYDTGKPLPDGWKKVCRFTKGKFLIVMKTCTYNHIPATYDGRHSVMSNSEFREYIEQMQEFIRKAKEKGYSEEAVLNSREFSRHPYPERREPVDFEISASQKHPCPDQFVKDHFLDWDFSSLLSSETGKGKLSFRFIFKLDGFISLFSDNPIYYLAEDGRITELKQGSARPFEVFDREIAIRTLESLNEAIKQKCEGYDVSRLDMEYNFDIEWSRIEMPEHLFTKEEIAEEMKKADDRVNNQLVINEDGYVQVLPIEGRGYGSLYPVSHEIWGSRNGYVGRYSTLVTLDEDYADSLDAWLSYLKSGQRQYCNLNTYANPSELLAEINTLLDIHKIPEN